MNASHADLLYTGSALLSYSLHAKSFLASYQKSVDIHVFLIYFWSYVQCSDIFLIIRTMLTSQWVHEVDTTLIQHHINHFNIDAIVCAYWEVTCFLKWFGMFRNYSDISTNKYDTVQICPRLSSRNIEYKVQADKDITTVCTVLPSLSGWGKSVALAAWNTVTSHHITIDHIYIYVC